MSVIGQFFGGLGRLLIYPFDAGFALLCGEKPGQVFGEVGNRVNSVGDQFVPPAPPAEVVPANLIVLAPHMEKGVQRFSGIPCAKIDELTRSMVEASRSYRFRRYDDAISRYRGANRELQSILDSSKAHSTPLPPAQFFRCSFLSMLSEVMIAEIIYHLAGEKSASEPTEAILKYKTSSDIAINVAKRIHATLKLSEGERGGDISVLGESARFGFLELKVLRVIMLLPNLRNNADGRFSLAPAWSILDVIDKSRLAGVLSYDDFISEREIRELKTFFASREPS